MNINFYDIYWKVNLNLFEVDLFVNRFGLTIWWLIIFLGFDRGGLGGYFNVSYFM
jgi:hypothetical protein